MSQNTQVEFDREAYLDAMMKDSDDIQDKLKRMNALSAAENAGFQTIEAYSAHLRQPVLDAIEERGLEWRTQSLRIGSGVHVEVRYPYELALRYALARTNAVGLTQPWRSVSERGLKMASDSSLHTDLWLAMGFDLDGGEYITTDHNSSVFYRLISELQYRVAGFEMTIINGGGLSTFKGKVVTPDSAKITKNDILVIPTAGVEFDVIARKAGVVICSVGSRMAHLAVVGREAGLPLIRIDEAHTKFVDGMSMEINFDSGTVAINPSLKF